MSIPYIKQGVFSIRGDRDSQQDSWILLSDRDDLLLASVCDGMGGLSGGEKASQTCTKIIEKEFEDAKELTVNDSQEWMIDTLNEADAAVASLKKGDGSPLGGGSTCVMVLADRHAFQIGNVGDSRISLLRDGILYTLNNMHNYNYLLEKMVENGEIDEEERKMRSVDGEALVSYLGMGNLAMLDTSEKSIPWKKNDWLILCSDGLYKSLNDKQITAILEESGDNPSVAAERLCMEADRLKRRKQDNTTVIVLWCKRTEGNQV